MRTEIYQPKTTVDNSNWTSRRMRKFLWILLVICVLFMFFPWTQNIQSQGVVTTLLPNQKPQEIQAIIGGKLEKWYVKEGDFVNKGDTIVKLSEIKDTYLDPQLLTQTKAKLQAKESSVVSYSYKINSINSQITQLEINRDLKLKQTENKVKQEELKVLNERAEMEASVANYNISKTQYLRDSALMVKGLKSKLEVENRRIKMQEGLAKKISSENKYKVALNSLENTKFEIRTIQADFGEKLAKAESDRYSSISAQLESESEVAGLRNSLNNYIIRNGFYIITAPQDGYVTKTLTRGLGELVKEATPVCTIMPSLVNMAVEMYIEPVDMPLVQKGNYIRFVFDGWPTVVFSGWPQFSHGTFPGTVFAIDKTPSENGKYRILVAPHNTEKKWPEQLRVGTGARGYMLLKKVSVWYEIWRKLNGFPPDYYVRTNKNSAKKNEK